MKTCILSALYGTWLGSPVLGKLSIKYSAVVKGKGKASIAGLNGLILLLFCVLLRARVYI